MTDTTTAPAPTKMAKAASWVVDMVTKLVAGLTGPIGQVLVIVATGATAYHFAPAAKAPPPTVIEKVVQTDLAPVMAKIDALNAKIDALVAAAPVAKERRGATKVESVGGLKPNSLGK